MSANSALEIIVRNQGEANSISQVTEAIRRPGGLMMAAHGQGNLGTGCRKGIRKKREKGNLWTETERQRKQRSQTADMAWLQLIYQRLDRKRRVISQDIMEKAGGDCKREPL